VRISRRRIVLAIIVAAPLELAGAVLLRYTPRIGVPPELNPWLRLGGDIAALVHAPWLALADYLCLRYCPPAGLLRSLTIAGGYLDLVLLVFCVPVLMRLYRWALFQP